MPLSCRNLSDHYDFQSFLNAFDGLDDYHQRHRIWGDQQAMTGVFALCEPGRATSYGTACEQLFDWIGPRFHWKTSPSSSGLHRARESMTDSGEDRVWHMALRWAEERRAPVQEALPGKILVAVDGSGMIMPRSASTSAAYGIRHDRDGNELCHYPEAQLVSAWDVERRLPLAWRLVSSSAKGGERAQCLNLLDELPTNAVLLLDRGYPSRKLLGSILESGRDFLVRMVAGEHGSWQEIRDFTTSKATSAIVSVRMLIKGELVPVKLRALKRIFSRGRPQRGQKRDTMILLTNLVDPSISDQQLIDIYAKRWVIETIHDELKNLSAIETWHSTTVKGIKQEMLCHMLWHLFAGHISSHLEAERQAADPAPQIRANSARVLEAAREITNYLFESIHVHPAVKEYLLDKAERKLEFARKQIVKRRKRKSRPRKPFHPHAKPRRGHGK
jgi:Transposase DDE domain